jgi:hypothetical protein
LQGGAGSRPSNNKKTQKMLLYTSFWSAYSCTTP